MLPVSGDGAQDPQGGRTSSTRLWARGALSAGGDPRWLNQATLKGGLLIAAGATIMASPSAGDLWTAVLGALLLAWAVIDIVPRLRAAGHMGLGPVVQSIVLVVAGISLLVPATLDGTIVLGVALVAFGAVDLFRGARARGPDRATGRDRYQAAVLELLLGGMALVLPETVALGLRAVFGVGAIVAGLILIAAGLRSRSDEELARFDAESASTVARSWLAQQQLAAERRSELTDALYFEPPNRLAKLLSFWVMMALATAIASFAIIQDSTAVVIGAMLVAPLMTPIMGAAAATVNGWLGRFGASMALAAAAVAVAIAVGWLIAAWLPSVGDLSSNAQITSRVEPSLVDLCIAVTAGAAGAYATVDPRVSSSLSGVAVAVALVPPLAVVGITLEAGAYGDAGGAFLLFATNFVSILLVGSLVFALTGFAAVPASTRQQGQARRVLRSAAITGVLIAVPLSLTSEQIWATATEQGEVEDAVGDWLDDTDLRSSVELRGEQVIVVLEGSDEPPDAGELDDQLEAVLDRPFRLRVSQIPTVELYGGSDGST